MTLSMIFSFNSVSASAVSEVSNNGIFSTWEENDIMVRASETLNKINGVAREKGGITSYTSTTTHDCKTIKAEGNLLGSNTGGNVVIVHIYHSSNPNVPVAFGRIPLDGQFHTIATTWYNKFKTGTYTIRVQPEFSGGYDIATYFYY